MEDPTISEVFTSGPPLRLIVETDGAWLQLVRPAYAEDPFFSKILSNPEDYRSFKMRDGLIWGTSRHNNEVLCIPNTSIEKRKMREVIIDTAHTILGHLGSTKTAEYTRRWYWWPRMGHEIEKFVSSCGTCQMTKGSNQRPAGLLHTMPIPTRPWSSIGMDFVGPFPLAKGYDYLWVIVCRLTSMTHLVPVTTKTRASELAGDYLREIVRLHGIPESIVSDRDTKFTSTFWCELHRLCGVKLLMSTSFHPETDGTTECTIKNIAQIFRSMVKPDQLDWVDKVPMAEFAINSSINSSTGFAPFELNYGYMPIMMQTPQNYTQYKGVQEFARQAIANLEHAHDAIIESRVNQTFYTNKRRRRGDIFAVNDLVYLSTVNLNMPKGRARKLLPKYIGPFKVTEIHPKTSNYTLDLPECYEHAQSHDS